MRRWLNVGLPLCQHRRRWANSKPTSGQRLMFAGTKTFNKWPTMFTSMFILPDERRWLNVDLLLGQRRRRWANSKPMSGQRLMFAGTKTFNKWPTMFTSMFILPDERLCEN